MPMPSFIREHKLATTLVLLILAAILIFALWIFIALHFAYSTGERAGYLQKFSKRGWFCKTWEGDLQLMAQPGVAPEMFAFSARSDSIAAELNKVTGQRVVLTYQQHKGLPRKCFGETEYFVVGVRPVGAP
jgi:hypothetical protein